MKFELISLSGVQYSGDVAEVALKTATGQLAILPGHEPIQAIALAGPVEVRPRGSEHQFYAIFGGLIEVLPDGNVRVLADETDAAEDLVHEEVEAALAKAQELKSHAKDKYELHRAQELIDRHAVRLEVSRLHRRHRARHAKRP